MQRICNGFETTVSINTHAVYTSMKNTNEKQTSGTSATVFNSMSLRYIKEDLAEISDKIYEVKEKLKDEDLRLSLDIADDWITEVFEGIQQREDKVEELIKSIANWEDSA